MLNYLELFLWFSAEVVPYQSPGGHMMGTSDSYTRVMVMLETLRMTELFPKFRAAMIKVLGCG